MTAENLIDALQVGWMVGMILWVNLLSVRLRDHKERLDKLEGEK